MTAEQPPAPGRDKSEGVILLQDIIAHFLTARVIELDVLQGIEVAGDIALTAGLVDDNMIIADFIKDSLPDGGPLGADQESSGNKASPVAQEHGFQGTEEGFIHRSRRFNDLKGLMGLEVQGADAAIELAAGHCRRQGQRSAVLINRVNGGVRVRSSGGRFRSGLSGGSRSLRARDRALGRGIVNGRRGGSGSGCGSGSQHL